MAQIAKAVHTVCLLSALALFSTCRADQEQEAFNIGIDAYIFGYPLVLMDVTKQVSTNVHSPDNFRAPINQFAHATQFPTPNFRLLPSPDVDTLASLAWLDLSKEPIVLHVPEITERYYLIELVDGWTNVMQSIGPRTSGDGPQDFVICGPNFNEEVPKNITQIQAPTNMVCVIGRTECYGKNDYTGVQTIQSQYALTPLSNYGGYYAPPASVPINLNIDTSSSPAEQVALMDALQFFKRLVKLMQLNPPAAHDAPLLEKMTKIGITSGKEFEGDKLDESVAKGLRRAAPAALGKISSGTTNAPVGVTGWTMPIQNPGAFGTNYTARAIMACTNLGADLPQDIVYAYAQADINANRLTGSKKYIIHFDADQTPPVNAFWSLTLYDDQHFFVPNSINRYAVHSFSAVVYDTLLYNADGSLDIFIQKEAPAENSSNWLPCPRANFNLILRMYWPEAQVLNGSWQAPPVNVAE